MKIFGTKNKLFTLIDNARQVKTILTRLVKVI